MNYQQQETEAQRQERLQKLALQRLAADEARHEEQRQKVQRQHRDAATAEAVARWQHHAGEIRAKMPAHEATIQAATIELNQMVESGVVDFNRIAEILNTIEASYAPIEAVRQQAIGERSSWVSQQPGYNPNAGLFALGTNPQASPFGSEGLPEAKDAHTALRAWCEANPTGLRRTIYHHFHPQQPPMSYRPG